MVMPGSEIQLQVFDSNSHNPGGGLYFDVLN
jgi:hypothetical protein